MKFSVWLKLITVLCCAVNNVKDGTRVVSCRIACAEFIPRVELLVKCAGQVEICILLHPLRIKWRHSTL